MIEKVPQAFPSIDFCRKTYPVILNLLIGLSVSAFVLLLLVSYLIFFPYKAEYFKVQQNAQDQPMLALDYPIISHSEILRWSAEAAINIYNFDFSNWNVRLKEVSSLFTENGFNRFREALNFNGVLPGIISQKLQVTAVVTGSPVIVAEGLLVGRYTWKVSMPVLLTYLSSSEFRQRNVVLTILIGRISTADSPRGFAIEQFNEETAQG